MTGEPACLEPLRARQNVVLDGHRRSHDGKDGSSSRRRHAVSHQRGCAPAKQALVPTKRPRVQLERRSAPVLRRAVRAKRGPVRPKRRPDCARPRLALGKQGAAPTKQRPVTPEQHRASPRRRPVRARRPPARSKRTPAPAERRPEMSDDHGRQLREGVLKDHVTLQGARRCARGAAWTTPTSAGTSSDGRWLPTAQSPGRPGTTDVVANPRVVVEVLSKGTESYDHGAKQAGYLALPSRNGCRGLRETASRHRSAGQASPRPAPRRGWNGRRLQGNPPQPGRVRREDAPPGAEHARGRQDEVPARGVRRQLRQASRRRAGGRRRCGRGRRRFPRDGAARRRRRRCALGAAPSPSRGTRGCRHRQSTAGRPRVRARQGDRPPRHQAGQPLRDAKRHRQGARLRNRPGP
jgi:hypothetical protein